MILTRRGEGPRLFYIASQHLYPHYMPINDERPAALDVRAGNSQDGAHFLGTPRRGLSQLATHNRMGAIRSARSSASLSVNTDLGTVRCSIGGLYFLDADDLPRSTTWS